MKTCPYCGAGVPEGARFCPGCGAELTPAAAASSGPAPKKKRTGLKLAAGAAVLLLLVIAAAAAIRILPGLFGSDAGKFVSVQVEYFLTPVLDRLGAQMDRTAGDGKFSSDMVLTASAAEGSVTDSLLQNTSLSLKVDAEGDRLLAQGELTLMGSSILEGTVSREGSTVTFCLPELDENVYTADVGTLLESGGAEPGMAEGLTMPKLSGAEWKDLILGYAEVFSNALNEDNVTSEKGEVSLDSLGETFSGTVYTWRPTGEDLEATMLALADRLETDETLRKLILQATGGVIAGEEGETPEETLDRVLKEAADELRSSAREAGESADSADFAWEAAAEGDTLRLIRITTGGGQEGFSLEISGDLEAGRTTRLCAVSGGLPEPMITLEETESGSSSRGSLTAAETFSLSWDTDTSVWSPLGLAAGSYTLEIPGFSSPFTLQVREGAAGGTDHVLTLNLEGETDLDTSEFSFCLSMTEGCTAEMPAGTPVDITGWSADQLGELVLGMVRRFQENVLGRLDPSLYYGNW